jgi:hypothetical protein
MKNQTAHDPTVTLKLPSSVMGRALVQALRNAGIPVDAIGSVTSGYLFVRTTGRFGKRANTFRWFAAGSSEAVAVFALPHTEEEAENHPAADGRHGFVLPVTQRRVPTTVTYLRVWKELEQHARRAEYDLHAKRIAYFRGLGPPPDALDRELVNRAWATANQCLAAATDEMSQRASTSGPPGGPLGSSAGDSAATGSDSY